MFDPRLGGRYRGAHPSATKTIFVDWALREVQRGPPGSMRVWCLTPGTRVPGRPFTVPDASAECFQPLPRTWGRLTLAFHSDRPLTVVNRPQIRTVLGWSRSALRPLSRLRFRFCGNIASVVAFRCKQDVFLARRLVVRRRCRRRSSRPRFVVALVPRAALRFSLCLGFGASSLRALGLDAGAPSGVLRFSDLVVG